MWTDAYVSSDGGQVGPGIKRAKKGRTHTHTHRGKMGGARFDMSAPDTRDKPEGVPTNQFGIPSKVADEWM